MWLNSHMYSRFSIEVAEELSCGTDELFYFDVRITQEQLNCGQCAKQVTLLNSNAHKTIFRNSLKEKK